MTVRARTLLKAFAAVVIFLAVVPRAFATFPGSNGRIAYLNPTNPGNGIILTGLGLVINGGGYPAWSPDGSQLAFIRGDPATSTATLVIARKDGTGERTILGPGAFPPGPNIWGGSQFLSFPAWSADAKSIYFIRYYFGRVNGLYGINVDGSGLTEYYGPDIGIDDLIPDRPEVSSRGDLAFLCNVPGTPYYGPKGICVVSGGVLTTPVNPHLTNLPSSGGIAASSGGIGVLDLKWSPDGQTIVFVGVYGTFDGSRNVGHSEILRISKDGTGLVQLTQSPDACPGAQQSAASIAYQSVDPSPDGKSIVAAGLKYAATTSYGECIVNSQPFLWTLDSSGGPPTLLPVGSTPDLTEVAWQPIPQSLAFNILDGHNNPLKGMKVELRRTDDTLIDDQPINTAGGSYVFQDAIAPGDYVVRATLVDKCVGPCVAAFDILYAPGPAGPVWMEWRFTVTSSQPPPPYTLNFDGGDPLLVSYNIPADAADKLDDMADIYFRMRQFVDWVETRLTPNTGPTVSFYTFATKDPDTGSPVFPSGSYYSHANSKIIFGVLESAYENRDGIVSPGFDDDAPMNGEWHEFTHHLWATWVDGGGCVGDVDHFGYNDPDTCLSMNEGFAEFLPTIAAQDIPNAGSDASPFEAGSYYDSIWDLQAPTWAWGYRSGLSDEELAIAALFWDLAARNGNTQFSCVLPPNRLAQVVVYTNTLANTPIGQLWTHLTTFRPNTVLGLRTSYGHPPLTIDLDGDGVPDVAEIDIPFLMHGFYPIDTDQTLTASHTFNCYDVQYAQQRTSTDFRDGAVGETGHYVYDAAGAQTGVRIPRSKLQPAVNSNIGITVLDATGTPISGATVKLIIAYPGGQTTARRRLVSGSGALVHLELPAYFNYLLPASSPLPPCDPAHDVQVNVTLSVEAAGVAGTQAPTFNNCTYVRAVAAATGPAALSFTVTVPIFIASDTVPPITTAALSPQANGAGWNNSNVAVALTAVDNAGGSGVKQIVYGAGGAQTISSTTVPGAAATFGISNEGRTTVTFYATDNAGNSETARQAVVSIDKTAPAINCGAADGQWHATDVSILCSATDSVSGLANSFDANFTLATTVPAGTETANAPAGPHSVCDVAGNCANAGPIGSNMIDKKPPSIRIISPATGTYLLNQGAAAANYSCSDGGSGVASCAGPVANGVAISMATIGSNSFTVNASDKVGNVAAPQTAKYTVAYKICILYDPSQPVQSGSTIPVKLQLCDFNNADASSASIVIHATSLVQNSSNSSEIIQDSGNTNPGNNFRYDGGSGPTGGYIFNLSTQGLTTGLYTLSFIAGADPTTHTALFQVR